MEIVESGNWENGNRGKRILWKMELEEIRFGENGNWGKQKLG